MALSKKTRIPILGVGSASGVINGCIYGIRAQQSAGPLEPVTQPGEPNRKRAAS